MNNRRGNSYREKMNMHKDRIHWNWKKTDSKGSALLTVILFVAFLTILATTLLYITGMNYMIKQADYQNKKNFYTGETALEEIKAGLMEEIVSDAANEAYVNTTKYYVTAGTGDNRTLEYNGYFTKAVGEKLQTKIGTGDWVGYLSSLYTDSTHATLTMTDSTLHVDASGDICDSANYVIEENKGIVTIKGLKMTYINERGLATIISTNLELYAPEVDWDVDASISTLAVPAAPDPSDPEFASYDPTAAYNAAVASAGTKNNVDVSRCVRYTNWLKE